MKFWEHRPSRSGLFTQAYSIMLATSLANCHKNTFTCIHPSLTQRRQCYSAYHFTGILESFFPCSTPLVIFSLNRRASLQATGCLEPQACRRHLLRRAHQIRYLRREQPTSIIAAKKCPGITLGCGMKRKYHTNNFIPRGGRSIFDKSSNCQLPYAVLTIQCIYIHVYGYIHYLDLLT